MDLRPIETLYLDELTDGAVEAVEASLGTRLKPVGRAQLRGQLERLLGELEGRYLLHEAETADLHERGALWALARLGYETDGKLPKVLRLAAADHGPIEVVDGELSDTSMVFEHRRAARHAELAAIREAVEAHQQSKRAEALAQYTAARNAALERRQQRAERLLAAAETSGFGLDRAVMTKHLEARVPLPAPEAFGLTADEV